MTGAKPAFNSRAASDYPLLTAFIISLLLHFVVIGGVELGREMGFWKTSLLPRSMQSRIVEEVVKTAEQRRQQQQAQQQEPQETALVFIEVDPSQAVPEPPRDAKYYSSQSTLAANPDTADKQQAKVDGQQQVVPKSFDVMRPQQPAPKPEPVPDQESKSQLVKIQPKVQTPTPQPQPEPEPKKEEPTPKAEDGEMLVARAKPQPEPKPAPPAQQPKPKPRTLAEARAQKGIIEGPKMKQDGGVRRHSIGTSMDVKGTPFGSYDAAFIAAVQARWYSLLDERNVTGSEAGKVVLEFRLNKNGRITEMRVVESEVNEILSWYCQRAVLDPAPYAPFPSDLRRLHHSDFREVRFTFYYNR